MFARFKDIMQKLSDAGQHPETEQERVNMAAVMLLVEVMMADHHIDAGEKRQLILSTMELLQISREESAELVEQARQDHANLVSLYDLTRVINSHFDEQKKIDVLTHMWQIAYADRQWDKYEEHLIRKVADLLYISHKDFVQARHTARAQHTGST